MRLSRHIIGATLVTAVRRPLARDGIPREAIVPFTRRKATTEKREGLI